MIFIFMWFTTGWIADIIFTFKGRPNAPTFATKQLSTAGWLMRELVFFVFGGAAGPFEAYLVYRALKKARP